MRWAAYVLLVAALVPSAALAYVSPGLPAQAGAPRGFVNDFAGMLTPSEVEGLNAKLTSLEVETGAEIAVVTVSSLGGDTVENFAVELFKEWGIGKESEDNGVLLLVARDDRAVRIEVGYGLEGALTDAQSYWIIENDIVPAFREGKFSAGITAAVGKIAAAVRGEYVPGAEPPPVSSRLNVNWVWVVLFVPLWLGSILARSKSWWAGGVIGAVVGALIGLFQGFVWSGVVAIVLFTLFGLGFDYMVSRAFARSVGTGQRPPWWIGGRGFGGGGFGGFHGGGGFGGFGGGHSGGGGASGRW